MYIGGHGTGKGAVTFALLAGVAVVAPVAEASMLLTSEAEAKPNFCCQGASSMTFWP
jgi:hypothetical protein